MKEINNDEIIEFLIDKYPCAEEDKMDRKMKQFEREMEQPNGYYAINSYKKNGHNSLCLSKIIMWLSIFLIVIFMGIMICKK